MQSATNIRRVLECIHLLEFDLTDEEIKAVSKGPPAHISKQAAAISNDKPFILQTYILTYLKKKTFTITFFRKDN